MSPRQKFTARLGNLKGKGRDRGDDGAEGLHSVTSRAASSVTSGESPYLYRQPIGVCAMPLRMELSQYPIVAVFIRRIYTTYYIL